MANNKNTVDDYLKAVKRANRLEEIQRHGKIISTRPERVVKSKKVYSRKGNKKNPDYFSSDFFCNQWFL